MKFAGFDDWVEIFRGGKQTDSTGLEHDGDQLIDRAVATFNAARHEPPAVIGHPKMDDPAYGWVSGLKSEVMDGTKRLYARFRDVVPEFAAAVAAGLYKKRSAAFYNDGSLRHVGFLGAQAPAVKGLANIKFADDDAPMILFQQSYDKGGRMFANLNEFMEFVKFWKKESELPTGDPGSSGGRRTFSEEEVTAAKNAAVAKALEDEKKRLEAEFAEKEAETAKKTQREARQKEISSFCDSLVAEGKIPPSWVKSGLTAFMAGLDSDGKLAFAEGGDQKTPLAWFQEFLGGFGKADLFREIATKERAGNTAQFAEAKADADKGKDIAGRVNPKKA
jgi:hypothetical protein